MSVHAEEKVVLPRFDPRKVPVTRVDHHLPALDEESLDVSAVLRRCARQLEWKPEWVTEPRMVDRPSTPAAVLVPLVQQTGGLHVLLTQRAGHLNSHAGQIAFPGGKIDAVDADAVQAALREAQEEVGLAPASVRVLTQLPTYHTGSGFVIEPVLGLIQQLEPLQPNPDEVDEAFLVPLAYLMNPAHHRHHEVLWQGQLRHWLSMPYFDGAQERFIWGATAAMLRNLYHFFGAR